MITLKKITAILLASLLVAGCVTQQASITPSQSTSSDAASSIDSAIQNANDVQADGGTDQPLQLSDNDYAM